MKKKILTILLLVMVCVPIGFIFAGCSKKEEDHNYNMIMCKATNPAQIAVMDTTKSGHDTYVWLQRVSTYAQLNAGNHKNFTKSNLWTSNATTENELTQDVVNDFRDRIVNIKAKDPEAKFNIYVRDMDVLSAYQMAIEADLQDSDFNIILAEDGYGLYAAWSTRFVTGKSCDNVDEPYEQLLQDIQGLESVLESMKNGSYNANFSGDTAYEYVFAAATRPNVSIYLYTLEDIETRTEANSAIANSKIFEAAGFKTLSNGTKKINFVNKSLDDMYQSMSDDAKSLYRELAFGASESNKVDELFNRTQKQTLVIAGTAINSMAQLDLVEDVTSVDDIPQSAKNIAGFSEIQTNEEKLTAYNQFVEYKYVFTAIYNTYNANYDILYKDHPRCGPEEGKEANWTKRFGDKGKWQYYLVRDFFTNDEVGQAIGILPSGIGIDNFLSFGFEFKVAGWDSSFYKTFPEDSTLFLITTTPYGNYTNFSSTGTYLLDGEKHDNTETWNTYKLRQILDPQTYDYYQVDRLGNVKIKVSYSTDNGATYNDIFVACGTKFSEVDQLKDYDWKDASGEDVLSTPGQNSMFASALVINGTAKA